MLSDVGQWLEQHDVTIDLVTVWAMVVCFSLWGGSKARIWWSLRDTRDETAVGTTLKHGKGLESFVGFMMAVLYALTLVGFYLLIDVGFWPRFALRTGIVAALLGAAFYSMRLDYLVRRERKKGGLK